MLPFLLFILVQLQLPHVSSFSSLPSIIHHPSSPSSTSLTRPSSPSPSALPCSKNNKNGEIQISIIQTNEEIISLADLRYQEWMTDDPNPPNPSIFRMATAEIFHERDVDGSIVFLASMLLKQHTDDDSVATAAAAADSDGRGGSGCRKKVAVGAAELSPIELKGVLIDDDDDDDDDGNNSESKNAYENIMSSLYVTDVVASSAYRRHGIGSKLMNAVERKASEMDVRFVFLHVEYDNIGARRFYERLGYRDVDVEVSDGKEESERPVIAYFSLEDNGALSPPVTTTTTTLTPTTTKLKHGKGSFAMDTTRLAVNAGTVGQLLMVKNITSVATSASMLISSPSSLSTQASIKGSKNDDSVPVGGGFGKQTVSKRRKKRKR